MTKLGFYRPICFSGDSLLCYKRNKLFLYKDGKFTYHAKIKINGYRGFFSFTRFLTRLMHRYVYCGTVPAGKNYALVAANNGIYKVDLICKDQVDRVFSFTPSDMHRPLAMFEINGVKGFSHYISFGDYCYNKERKEMKVNCFNVDTEEWSSPAVFEAGEIRHIHSVIPDKYRSRVLVLTGDKNDECGIWEVTNNFKNIKILFRGKQEYRFCAGKAYEDRVILITDSPFEQNYLYSLTSSDLNNVLTPIYKIPGPTVFFSINDENSLIFATDVENDEKNLTPFQEFFINKRGDGVLDNFSHVFLYTEDNELTEIASFEKDALPMRLYGFGTVHFPTGKSFDNSIYMFPMSVKKYDLHLVKAEYEKD